MADTRPRTLVKRMDLVEANETADSRIVCSTCGQKVWFDTDGSGELIALNDEDHRIHGCEEI